MFKSDLVLVANDIQRCIAPITKCIVAYLFYSYGTQVYVSSTSFLIPFQLSRHAVVSCQGKRTDYKAHEP